MIVDFVINFYNKRQDALLEKLSGFISDKKEKVEMKCKLNKHFERYFRGTVWISTHIRRELDIDSLHKHLMEKLNTGVMISLIANTSRERSFYKDSLIRSSYEIVGADTKAKQQESMRI